MVRRQDLNLYILTRLTLSAALWLEIFSNGLYFHIKRRFWLLELPLMATGRIRYCSGFSNTVK